MEKVDQPSGFAEQKQNVQFSLDNVGCFFFFFLVKGIFQLKA